MSLTVSQGLLAFPGKPGVQVIETQVVDSPIESVVVYQDRAEVRRRLTLCLAAGENELIISGLADCVDQSSVRVEGKGKAVITDVIYSSRESSSDDQPPTGSKEELEQIKEEIADTQKELRHVEIRHAVLNEEKELLNKFANHVSTVHTVTGDKHSLSQLVDGDNVSVVIEFFQKVESKLSDLDSRLTVIAEEEKTLQDKLAVLQTNAHKLNPRNKKTTTKTLRTLHVGLEATEEGEAILFVSYVVNNASWSSSYDVRVFTKNKSMKVQYYGLIRQVTGEDWKDVKISLSTAQPSFGGSAPPLPTKIIRFKRPKLRVAVTYAMKSRSSRMRSSFVNEYDPTIEDSYGGMHEFASYQGQCAALASYDDSPPPSLQIEVAEITAGLFNATYAIPRASTIPSDDTEHKVTIALIDLMPELTYSTIPRLSPYSFLQANASNSSPYTILAGPANVFLDNNFIAKSEMSDVSPNEEFTMSLGADQSIRITARPVSTVHNTRGGLLGGTKTNCITYTNSFVVKNTRTDSVNIKVSEQVPLSTDDRIKVTVSEPGVRKVGEKCSLPFGWAELNQSNNLEWHAVVGAGLELEFKLVYTVEHPAQDGVSGLSK